MTSLFPHPSYAELQTASHTILYLHTMRAGAMMGSFVALLTASSAHLISAFRKVSSRTLFATRLLTYAPRGVMLGALGGALATMGRMRGREDIEWQDRAWRLLENQGEVTTDWAVIGGAGIGAAVGTRQAVGVGMRSVKGGVGGAAVGCAAGVFYMISTFARGRGK